MSKKAKKKKKNPKIQSPKTKPPIDRSGQLRLSQVMIVKNEEKNIEKALDWAKDIAFEQIVVDTGSTDRTVELAKKSGAAIYYFEWINDFSAAKNYAMEQATGDWIAFLDADEYMQSADVKKLMDILEQIQKNTDRTKQYDAIDTSMAHLDDDNNVYSVTQTRRFFRNDPSLRFEGKIHEAVRINTGVFNAPDLQIMHTGYAQTIYNNLNKKDRNMKILREEHDRNPDDPNIMIYLADSIKSEGTEEARAEAETLYLKALKSNNKADIQIKQLAYDFLIPRLSGDGRSPDHVINEDEALKLCDSAINDLPDMIDYYYYRAVLNNKKENYTAAIKDLEVCENAFITGNALPVTRVLLPSPMPLFYHQKTATHKSGDDEGFIKSSTILKSMMEDAKNTGQTDFIGSLIKEILVFGVSEDETLNEFSEVFDLNDPKDLMFIIRAAKDVGAVGFARKVMDITTEIMKNQ